MKFRARDKWWRTGRNTAVAGGVVMLHTAALWALQNGAARQPPELVVPAEIVAEFITPPAPAPKPEPEPEPEPAPPEPEPEPEPPEPDPEPEVEPEPEPEPPPPPPKPTPEPAPAPPPKPKPKPKPKPQPRPAPPKPVPPKPAPRPAPAPAAPTSAPKPAPAQAPRAAPTPAPVVLPSSTAAYLNNPPPAYPAISRRMGESGRVVVRVLIGTDGRASQASVRQSSGFSRLDQVALQTVRDRWRYKPGTRGGKPEAMWFDVPINFVLE